MTDHLARHHFEQYVADDPDALLAPALRVHVGGCDRCGTRKRALEAAKAHFLALHPAPDFAHRIMARATAETPAAARPWLWRSPRGVSVALAFALAAGTAVWSWFAFRPEVRNRAHSDVSLQAVAKHDGQTHVVRDGDALSFGDALVLEYTLAKPKHALVLGIDGSGAVTRYFPPPGGSDTALPATQRAELPIEIELDAQAREERVVALFADSALDEIEARAALVRAMATARDAQAGGVATLDLAGLPAEKVSFWFRKPE